MSKAIKFRNHQNEKMYPYPYFPIGYIYISTVNVNPATYFEGKWEQIKDRFLLTAGNTYKAGNTGGEATHKLSVSEMPSHSHGLIKNVPYGMPYNDTGGLPCGNGGGTFYRESYSPFSIANTGSDQAHNNMPPYLVVYAWKRVS